VEQVGQDVRDVCRDSGFDGFLAKPADRAAIVAEMERLVTSERRAAMAAEAAAGAAPCKPSPPPLLAQVEKLASTAAPGPGLFAKGEKPAAATGRGADGPGPSFVDVLDFDTPRPAF
jgi:hypothetical protein